jgi:hypothetical protein
MFGIIVDKLPIHLRLMLAMTVLIMADEFGELSKPLPNIGKEIKKVFIIWKMV